LLAALAVPSAGENYAFDSSPEEFDHALPRAGDAAGDSSTEAAQAEATPTPAPSTTTVHRIDSQTTETVTIRPLSIKEEKTAGLARFNLKSLLSVVTPTKTDLDKAFDSALSRHDSPNKRPGPHWKLGSATAAQ
jgi:hypothetical protein